MDFSRKDRMVSDRATNEDPSSLTYSYVVSRDSVRLAFLISELNDLGIMACDVGNEYLNVTEYRIVCETRGLHDYIILR